MTDLFHNVPASPPQGRSDVFSIVKALAIILVVLSHAGGPRWLNSFVFQFHVPVFFICAGYFFKEKYLTQEKTFIVKRLRGLYLPFVRWSLFFLVVHNLWFSVGILNEEFGNAAGGVLHPYTWRMFCQRLVSIVFNMSGYDEFLAGAFWFFRALFLGSVAFLVAYKLLLRLSAQDGRTLSRTQAGLAIGATGLLGALFLATFGLRVTGVAQGGLREFMAVAFMAAGYVFCQVQVPELPARVLPRPFAVLRTSWLPLAALAVLALFAAVCPVSMSYSAKPFQLPVLLLSGCAGFLLLRAVAEWLAVRRGWAAALLVYIGNHTLYVFAFHLLAFKLVSALKVALLGLPWPMVGCHTVVHEGEGSDLFFLLYLLVGVAVPLLWQWAYVKLEQKFGFTLEYSQLFRVDFLKRQGASAWTLLRFAASRTWAALICAGRGVGGFVLGVVRGIRAIVSASNPHDE